MVAGTHGAALLGGDRGRRASVRAVERGTDLDLVPADHVVADPGHRRGAARPLRPAAHPTPCAGLPRSRQPYSQHTDHYCN